jgi:putative transposase
VFLSFYEFPAEHWVQIRTTNPIESMFSTVRLRHDKTKGSGARTACLTMVFKLMESASKGWRSLNGSPLLTKVVRRTKFIDYSGSHSRCDRKKGTGTRPANFDPV